jgi:hypothetical protein
MLHRGLLLAMSSVSCVSVTNLGAVIEIFGLAVLFVPVRPHLLDQLFLVVLLFAHVTLSLDCAHECLMTDAIGTPSTFVNSDTQ